MTTPKIINLPMDIAREIAKFNDQTPVIEKLKTELEKVKAKAKIYKEAVFTMRETLASLMNAGICDVCSCITNSDVLTDCDACGCGDSFDDNKLCVCENCRPYYMTFDEELGLYFCNDCMKKEAVPRITRL